MKYFDSCFECDEVTPHDFNTESCCECKHSYNSSRFNFVIFKNYDGTVTSKVISRKDWARLGLSG